MSNSRQDLFGRTDVQQYRDAQLADMERRATATMEKHSRDNGLGWTQTKQEEITQSMKLIQEFSERQIDKMKSMGIGSDEIRVAIVGSIQSMSSNLSREHPNFEPLSRMVEKLNRGVENYIVKQFDKSQSKSMSMS